MLLNYSQVVHTICFADEATLIATGRNTWLQIKVMNDLLDMVAKFISEQGLTISSGKSTMVLLTMKKNYYNPSFIINGSEIVLRDSIWDLGVKLSSILDFRKHIETASSKAAKTTTALARLMLNVGGPSPEKRELLTSVVHSQLLYAAPIWHGALINKRNKTKLTKENGV